MKVAIIIPTHNRYENIINFIKNSCLEYNGELFNIYILDSSSDGKIQEYFCSVFLDNLHYIKFYNNERPDEKLKITLPKIKEDYFYVIGDGLSIDFNCFEKLLYDINYQNYKTICIVPQLTYYAKKNKHITQTWVDNDLFVNDNASLMTLYGAALINTQYYMKNYGLYYINYLYDKCGDGYCFQASICSAIKKGENDFFIRIFPQCVSLSLNQGKRKHWTETYMFFSTAFDIFQKTYSSIYNLNSKDLDSIYKNYYKKNWNSFRFVSLLKRRYMNIINFSNVRKNKIYLKKAKMYLDFLFICFIPKWSIGIIYKILKKGA